MTEERRGHLSRGRHGRPGRSPGAVSAGLCLGFVVCALVVLRAARSTGTDPTGRVAIVGADSTGSATTAGDSTGTAVTQRAATPSTSRVPTSTSTTLDAGALPQTDAQPATASAAFRSGSASLWDAVVHDDPERALPFFFPRSAYRQVKDIGDPDGDWSDRLVANFRTDVHALHQQLGTLPAGATFEGLDVPAGQAQWITPGVEFNKGPYWRVYGSRLRYTVDGVEHSLPVTSLISWRGEWYVVHLGAVR